MKMPESEFSQAPTVSRFPIETEEDALNFKIPALEKMPGVEREKRFHEMARGASPNFEPFSICLYAVSPFEVAGRLCRLENLARWMVRRPEIVHHLLRLTTDFLLVLTAYWKETFGTEGVLARGGGVSSSNQIISPRQFKQFILPYHKEAHEKVLEMGYRHIYAHICGDHNLNLPYWTQVLMGDPGIISIGHEVDLETAASYFPNDVIAGNLKPVILQTATPDEVYEETRKVIEKGKRLSGGYIFSLGCQLPPRSSLSNIKAMNQAIDDYGWY
jgi:uroporphyrinogen decarboxylase